MSLDNVILIVVAVNILLSASGKVLDMIKDKTSSDVDNKAAEIVSKVTGFLGKVVDFISANREHK